MNLFSRKTGSAPVNVEATLRTLRASFIADRVAEDVRRAAYPGYAPELVAALTNREVAQVDAAGSLPVDPNASDADACLVERLEALRADVSRGRERRAATRIASEEAGRRLHGLPRPMGLLALLAVHLCAIVGTAIVAAAIGALLAPSVDAYLLRSYITATFETDAGMFSASLSLWLAIACAAALLGGQLLAVLLTRGALSWAMKAAFVVFDAAFAGGFAVMRLGDGFSWQAVAVSLFEFAVSGVGTLMLLAVARTLRRDAERAEPFRIAKQEHVFCIETERQTVSALESAETSLAEQVHRLGEREDALRRHERLRELARATATAEYAVATSKMIGDETRNESATALMDHVDRHLHADRPHRGNGSMGT